LISKEKIKKKMKKELLLLILAILLLIATSWIAWNYYDISVFLEWAKIAESKNVLRIYSDARKAGYMPLAPIVFVATYIIAKGIFEVLVQIATIVGAYYLDFMKLFMRIPLLLTIVATGFLLYKKEGWKVAKWWFFGIPVWIVYLAYQFDPLMVFFMVWGAYLFVEKKYRASGFLWGIGTALKFVPILFVPLAFKVIHNRSTFLKFLLSFSIPVVVISLPFLLFNPVLMVKKVLEFHASRYPQMLSIFNVPMLLTNHKFMFSDILSWIWIPTFLIAYVMILISIKVYEGDKDSLFVAFALITLAFIIFNKVQNPQYILWSYPFLVYTLNKIGGRRLKYALLIATLLGSVIFPLLYYVPPAVLNEPILIEEDMKLYSARDLLIKSFEGSGKFIIEKFLDLMHKYLLNLNMLLYNNFNILGALAVSIYNILLLLVFSNLVKFRCNLSIIIILLRKFGKNYDLRY